MATRKRRLVSEINVVPYIDVMLVLLIIFMVTAPLLKQGVEVDLPQAPSKTLDVKSPEPIVISVTKTGEKFLNVATNPEQAIDDSTLIEKLQNERLLDKNRAIMIRGDRDSPYQFIMDALVLLQQADIQSVGLITDSVPALKDKP
ncbi:MAG: protein TolR [Gammaproteobacteria bacterium]|nr:protein TolR [Gammaproteobacteria bacterium]